MNQLEVEIRVTGDGSLTLYRPDLDEGYHSRHGALQESRHVFIEAGLEQWRERNPGAQEVRVFEFGFGTGMNALLAWEWARRYAIRVTYVTLEKYPLDEETWSRLQYPVGAPQDFSRLHRAAWDQEVVLDAFFCILKLYGEYSTDIGKYQYNVIFFDAFAPEKQPELWGEEMFQGMHALLLPGGILVTYCAKGQVRRNMQAAGFQVERLPGPPGKREMLRAERPRFQ